MRDESPEIRTLVPGRDVKLLDGTVARVRPWGWAQGAELAPRIAALFEGTEIANRAGLAQVISERQVQVEQIVLDTMGWGREDAAKLYYEDMLALFQAVVEVCVLRVDEDGEVGGALGKLMALARAKDGRKTGAETSPESSSS